MALLSIFLKINQLYKPINTSITLSKEKRNAHYGLFSPIENSVLVALIPEMPQESKAAQAYRAAESRVRSWAQTEAKAYEHWHSAKGRLNAALADGRSHKTIRKAQNYESNARDKYEDAMEEKHHAEKLRDEAFRRLEIEEAASHRLGGDLGVMIGEKAYGYQKDLYR
ncbi:hypothetical protein AJ78_06974 [Emergomyces pasteurianus Ep9510]|uniref:Uncharacterized protein n=1 Tax=Emergomyces pasteurianus Ep9510 TaxID=1447872 RepID=A0A1J9P704_9EURO|nr:hypothetical protein AJ78_06974 [Emergomyces pasteurianus Ep9510]